MFGRASTFWLLLSESSTLNARRFVSNNNIIACFGRLVVSLVILRRGWFTLIKVCDHVGWIQRWNRAICLVVIVVALKIWNRLQILNIGSPRVRVCECRATNRVWIRLLELNLRKVLWKYIVSMCHGLSLRRELLFSYRIMFNFKWRLLFILVSLFLRLLSISANRVWRDFQIFNLFCRIRHLKCGV